MPAPHLIPIEARRHAFFRLGAQMCAIDTGTMHGPLLPTLDTCHGSYSGPCIQDDGESRAWLNGQPDTCPACSGTGLILGIRAYGSCVTADGGPKRYPCPRCSDAR